MASKIALSSNDPFSRSLASLLAGQDFMKEIRDATVTDHAVCSPTCETDTRNDCQNTKNDIKSATVAATALVI